LWKVLKQRDVMQYGLVEEFVTSACETVPGLLNSGHHAMLALGLTARVSLITIMMSVTVPSDKCIFSIIKMLRKVENFPAFVRTLLTNPAERKQYFKVRPLYSRELEKLLWEFLIRLDQFLPVPNLAQTVSWLSNAPAVLEECAHAATQPQLLKILLQHQTSLGHLEPAASLPSNMGDSLLDSLSLPLSGRVPSNCPTGSRTSDVGHPSSTRSRDQTPFITPVIGGIANEQVPVMISASKTKLLGGKVANKHLDPVKNLKFTGVKQRQKATDADIKEFEELLEEEKKTYERSRMKRKQPDKRESESDEEEQDVLDVSRSKKERVSRLRLDGTNESKEDAAKTVRNEECKRAVLMKHVAQLGFKRLHLPEDPTLYSISESCLSCQPRVVIEKLTVTSAGANGTGGGGKSLHKEQRLQRKKSPVKTITHRSTSNQSHKPDSDFPNFTDKDGADILSESILVWLNDCTNSAVFSNRLCLPQLFMKRYYKTKHGTYVPTLREFWKPRMVRRDLLSVGRKHR
uniref:TERF1-interacting nuclear factor 2 N-terminal domain-containing protein n=1 Tax=Mastacembelus armatus TaxID=205130 RepID=A0A3Q3SDY2_9TELE